MDIAGQILSELVLFIRRVIETGGYPGLALFMVAASMNLPLPSEIAYGFSGFLAARRDWQGFNLGLVIVIGALANVLGASLNYWVGIQRKRRNPDGDFLLVPAARVAEGRAWATRWGNWGVFFGHLAPGIRAFIGFPAGLLGIRFSNYFGVTLVASFIWAAFWSSLGYKLGVEWEKVSVYARKFDVLILALVVSGGVWWLKKAVFFKKS